MGRSYSDEDAIKKFEEALCNPADLYKDGCLNWSGRCKGGGDYYTELMAARLLQDPTLDDLLGGIKSIERHTSYHTPSHQPGSGLGQASNRREEILAKSVMEFPSLGIVKDYQVPLKDTMGDKGVGKIDLIVRGQGELWLVELKYLNRSETLLRCALEIATYFQQVHHEKLLQSFDVPRDIPIRKAVAFDRSCLAFDEFEEMAKGSRPQLQTLLRRLQVTVVHFEPPALKWVDVKVYDPRLC